MPAPYDTSYLIDDVAVPQLYNVRHVFLPGGPPTRVEHRFPGIPERYIVKGPAMPHDLTIVAMMVGVGTTGPLAIQDLIAGMKTQNNRRDSQLVYDVTIHGEEFTDMELVDFRAMGGELIVLEDSMEGDPPEAVKRLTRAVLWSWRQVTEVAI
jgi:hypothetical protein